VVEGFPHSDVYFGLAGVTDFFTRLFSDFEDWHTEPSEFFEAATASSPRANTRREQKRRANPSRRVLRTSGRCATASSLGCNNALIRRK
jgi:hypothetical protein